MPTSEQKNKTIYNQDNMTPPKASNCDERNVICLKYMTKTSNNNWQYIQQLAYV